VAFFQNLAQSLSKNGILVLVTWSVSRPERDGETFARKRRDIVGTLLAKGIPLPEDEAAFRSRIERHDNAHRARMRVKIEPAEIEANFAAAGLRVRERLEHAKRFSPAIEDGQSLRAITHFFIASH
jgi:hypothetical protein